MRINLCILFVLFFYSCISFGQAKEIKNAYELFQAGKIEEVESVLQNFMKSGKTLDADDKVLYYWVYSHALAAEGPKQNLDYAYDLTGYSLIYSYGLTASDPKTFDKISEKYGCSMEALNQFVQELDDKVSGKLLKSRSPSAILEFIENHENSTHLYELSDCVDLLNVDNAIRHGRANDLEFYTKIENYNTPPVDLVRKAELYNKCIQQVNKRYQQLLEQSAVETKSSENLKLLKQKFPESAVIISIEKESVERAIANVQGLLNLNKVDLIHFRKKPSGESQENTTTDILPEEFNVAAYDGAKLVSITQIVSQSTKYIERKFFFNQNQEVVAIEATVKPIFYELPVNTVPVKEEYSKIYFYEAEVIFTEGALLSKADLIKGNELKRRADLNRNSEIEKRPDFTMNLFNPYSWNLKPTHTILYNQEGYSVSIAVACVNADPEMSIEGEAVVTLKKGSLEQKFRLEAAFPFLQQQFINGVYRLAESEIEQFPFLQFKDCNFDGFLDLGINETAGSYDAGMTWYTWNEVTKSFIMDYQMLDLYFGGELTFTPEDKSITVFTFQDGTSESTYRYDNGLWRDVNDSSSYSEYDEETENAYGVYYRRYIKSGQVIIENSRELLKE